eukprot:14774975-Ditylum_brightwellii.AAC.1
MFTDRSGNPIMVQMDNDTREMEEDMQELTDVPDLTQQSNNNEKEVENTDIAGVYEDDDQATQDEYQTKNENEHEYQEENNDNNNDNEPE